MEPRKLRLGFLLATGAIALAFVLPTRAGSAATCWHGLICWKSPPARAYCSCSRPGSPISARSSQALSARLLAAAASLMLLNDASVAGSAQIGFWMLVIAAWLAVALGLVNLADLRSRGAGCNAR